MIRRVPDIACDACGNWVGDFDDESDAGIRRQAGARGWRRRKHEGKLIDLCPACVKALDHAKLRGSAFRVW